MVSFSTLQDRYETISELYNQHLHAKVVPFQAELLRDVRALLLPPLHHDAAGARAGVAQNGNSDSGMDAKAGPSAAYGPAADGGTASASASDVDRAVAFLQDPVTVFRFLRKALWNESKARELLRRTLAWRFASSIDLVSPSAVDTLYSEQPLLYLHPSLVDKFGRQAAVLNLAHVVRPEDNSLEALKEFVAFQLEVFRRYLADGARRVSSAASCDSGGAAALRVGARIQIVILLDLKGASFSNLEVEMLPFVVDLLKHHFPGMVGATYVLNYGWAYAGMWQVAKRVLPKVALERILFPSKDELLTYFDREHLHADHGGSVNYRYRLSNNHILTKYGRPAYFLRQALSRSRAHTPTASAAGSPTVSRPVSRVSSFESLHDIYYSLPSTPRTPFSRTPAGSHGNLHALRNNTHSHAHKHPSWLDMTMSRSPSTDKPSLALAAASVDPLPIAHARFQRSMLFNGGAAQHDLDYDYYHYESGSDSDEAVQSSGPVPAGGQVSGGNRGPGADWEQESLESSDGDEIIVKRSNRLERATPNASRSRAQSLARLKTQLEDELSPLGKPHQQAPTEGGAVHSGTRSGYISPFNAANPYFGYAATRYAAPTADTQQSSVRTPFVRPYHTRRRKRDLVRTLSYLIALRLLAAHRKLKWRLGVFAHILWDGLRRWGAVSVSVAAPGRTRRATSQGRHDTEHEGSASDGEGGEGREEDDGPDASSASLASIYSCSSAKGARIFKQQQKRKKKGVRWDSDVVPVDAETREQRKSSVLARAGRTAVAVLNPLVVLRLFPRWMIFLAAVLLFRSTAFKRRARRIIVSLNARLRKEWLQFLERRRLQSAGKAA